MKKHVIFCMLFMLLSALAEPDKKETSLVVPQDVTWSIKQIGLTRSIEGVSGGNKTIRNQSQNLTSNENLKESNSKNSESGSSKSSGRGWNADGKASAGLKWGIVPTASAEGSIGGKASSESAEQSKTASASGTASAKEQSSQKVDGSRSEGLEEERYGGYCLKFSLVLKSSNPADSFCVCATNAKIRLLGLTVPVVIPCNYGEFRLGAEERIMDFIYPIKDQTLLRELVEVSIQGSWQKLSVELVGYEFPIVSEASGKNVVTEMRVAEQNSPTTEIAVEFGDVARLSPWRVKQRHGRASGKRGKLVTVHDALVAINELVALNEEMPEQTFMFDENGSMTGVCDVSFVQKPTAKSLSMIGIRVDGDDDAMKVHAPKEDFLDLPIRNFRKVEFLPVEMSDVAEAVKGNDDLAMLREEVASFACLNGFSNLWCELTHDEGQSPVANDTEKASDNEVVKKGCCVIFGETESLCGVDYEVHVNGFLRGTVKAKGQFNLTDIKEGDILAISEDIFGLCDWPKCRYKIRKELYDLRITANGKVSEVAGSEK